jgi:putative pyruvate formate lyase activating enzyme
MHDMTAEIRGALHQLKVERDTWQAVALQYKAALKGHTMRFQELQDVCFATQAELENERAQYRRLHAISDENKPSHPNPVDGAVDMQTTRLFGTAVVFPSRNAGHERAPSDECTNALFDRVQQCVEQRNYGSGLVELECLLRGPLSPKARAEGLLLKSSILRAAGPDELYDALAACSEALELCDRLSDLECFLPRIQYQRGVLYYQLRMLHQAREAFSAVGETDRLSATAKDYRRSCDDEIGYYGAANRRSGFDENRGFDQGLLVHLDEKLDVSHCQCARHTTY